MKHKRKPDRSATQRNPHLQFRSLNFSRSISSISV